MPRRQERGAMTEASMCDGVLANDEGERCHQL